MRVNKGHEDEKHLREHCFDLGFLFRNIMIIAHCMGEVLGRDGQGGK